MSGRYPALQGRLVFTPSDHDASDGNLWTLELETCPLAPRTVTELLQSTFLLSDAFLSPNSPPAALPTPL